MIFSLKVMMRKISCAETSGKQIFHVKKYEYYKAQEGKMLSFRCDN